MAFDPRRLRPGEQIAAVSAVLLFADLFLTWYAHHFPTLRAVSKVPTNSGWSAHSVLGPLLVLLILAALALAALRAARASVALPVAAAVVVAAFGAVMLVVLLYRVLVDVPGPDRYTTQQVGAYLGLLFCAGIAFGGFRAIRDEGTALPEARAQAERAIGSRERTVPDGSSAAAPAPSAAPSEADAPAAGGTGVGEPPPATPSDRL